LLLRIQAGYPGLGRLTAGMNLFRKLFEARLAKSTDGDDLKSPPAMPATDTVASVDTDSGKAPTPFQRMANDQHTGAIAGGAIAAKWHWNGGTSGCWVAEHEIRNGRVYAVRDNWAEQRGFMTAGDGYADEIIKPLGEDECRCHFQYLYNLRDLPEEMVTAQGKDSLAKARQQIEALRRR